MERCCRQVAPLRTLWVRVPKGMRCLRDTLDRSLWLVAGAPSSWATDRGGNSSPWLPNCREGGRAQACKAERPALGPALLWCWLSGQGYYSDCDL